MFKNWRCSDWVLFGLILAVFVLGIVILSIGLSIRDGELRKALEDDSLLLLPTDALALLSVNNTGQDMEEELETFRGYAVQGLEYVFYCTLGISLLMIVSHLPAFLGVCCSSNGGRVCILIIFMLLDLVAIAGGIVSAVLFRLGQEFITLGCAAIDEFINDKFFCSQCPADDPKTYEDCYGGPLNYTRVIIQGNGTFPENIPLCYYNNNIREQLCEQLPADFASIFVLLVIAVIAMVVGCFCSCFVCCSRKEDYDEWKQDYVYRGERMG